MIKEFLIIAPSVLIGLGLAMFGYLFLDLALLFGV